MKSVRIALSLFTVAALPVAAFAAPQQMLGYQLDVSRCKVPKMETIYRIVDILADLRYNQFQLYTEHTFAYKGHETVWYDASPMTPDEVRALDDYCHARGIELVPNQNSFGHMEQWLRHPGYAELDSNPLKVGAKTLNPEDPRSLELVKDLYDQLLPCFRSRYFNVGCDETDLAGGRCDAAVKEKGSSRVYVDFLKKIHAVVAKRNHTMMFWGDIILKHPEFLPELPKDMVCLDWGYRPESPFDKDTAALKAAGIRFVVCPGTSAWGSLFGRVDRFVGNIDNAVENGTLNGAEGYLLADWGDGGNPQPWIVSLPSIIYLAHRVRGEKLTADRLAAEIDRICGCRCGAALLAYGAVYRTFGGRLDNTAEICYVLRDGKQYVRHEGVTDEGVVAAFAQLDGAKELFIADGAPAWVREDFAVLDLLARAVKARWENPQRDDLRVMFEPEYRRLWLRQNRIGGLKDSLFWLFGRTRK